MLREIVDLFLVECPKQMAEIEHARDEDDPQALTRAAHTLKGSLSMFAADRARNVARRIEKMGSDNDLSDFDEAWIELEQRVDELVAAMSEGWMTHSDAKPSGGQG
jgi:HPt (histidine-containing phosphotransfer) domain-containing protein